MIYLDNAATSYPKSPAVCAAMARAVFAYGANPGRGGYPLAMATAEQLYYCRETAARLFDMRHPEGVIFTPSCTHALNIVLKSCLANGGRAVVSDLEHNAVMRPLHAIIPRGIDIAHVTVGDDEATVEAFRHAMTPHTKVLVCTHASNVVGCALPIARLAALAHEHGIPIVVDAAQSAGHLPILLERDELDYVCVAGHKGLGGPMGTGLLLCRELTPLLPLIEGGTGSASASLEQPPMLPDRLESGTPNVTGICGLHAALAALGRGGVSQTASREVALCRRLYHALSSNTAITLYSSFPHKDTGTPLISLRIADVTVDDVCDTLAKHGIAVRGGLHCAPAAHKSIDTFPEGTVRFSIGTQNTGGQIDYTAQILEKIAKNPLCFRRGYDKILTV